MKTTPGLNAALDREIEIVLRELRVDNQRTHYHALDKARGEILRLNREVDGLRQSLIKAHKE